MAEVNQREWKRPGQRTKRLAWGFTVTVNGKRTRRYQSGWTREQAEQELARFQLGIEQPRPELQAVGITFGQAVESYLASKVRKKSIKSDARYAREFVAAFGAGTPLAEITSSKINAWKSERLAAICPQTGEPYSAAAINRPLAALRHLLKLAQEEGHIPEVPRIRMEREPQGRMRWLEPDEEARFLDVCAKSPSRWLLPIVTVAMETGLRRGELLGLTWDRVDMTRGVLRLEITKSGRRREVPMRQVVYDTLAALPGKHEGRVWPVRLIRSSFETAVKAAKLDAPLRFHDLRHHFASWYMMRGGSLPALQQVLGHATITMTMRYAHLSPGHLRDEMTRTEAPPSVSNRAHGLREEVSLLAK